jgi:hypothetical protein
MGGCGGKWDVIASGRQQNAVLDRRVSPKALPAD